MICIFPTVFDRTQYNSIPPYQKERKKKSCATLYFAMFKAILQKSLENGATTFLSFPHFSPFWAHINQAFVLTPPYKS